MDGVVQGAEEVVAVAGPAEPVGWPLQPQGSAARPELQDAGVESLPHTLRGMRGLLKRRLPGGPRGVAEPPPGERLCGHCCRVRGVPSERCSIHHRGLVMDVLLGAVCGQPARDCL